MFTGGHEVLKGEGCIWSWGNQCFTSRFTEWLYGHSEFWVHGLILWHHSFTGSFHGIRAVSMQKNSSQQWRKNAACILCNAVTREVCGSSTSIVVWASVSGRSQVIHTVAWTNKLFKMPVALFHYAWCCGKLYISNPFLILLTASQFCFTSF